VQTKSVMRRYRALTVRQETILLRVYRNNGHDWISPDIARQLIRRGLIEKVDRYQSISSGKTVKGAILWKVALTSIGRIHAKLVG
jgi:hypothetical protein